MSFTTVAWSMVAAVCMTLAIVHAMTWFLRIRSSSYFFSSITALAAAGNAFTELVMLRADNIEIYARAMKWEVFFAGILLIGLIWFVKVYFDTARQWLAVVITVSWAFLLIVNIFSPVNLVYSEITSLNEGSLPWGEHFVYATGTANPWNLPANVLPLVIIAYVVDASVHLWKSKNRKRAVTVGGAIVFFLLAAGLHATLVDRGIIDSPYLISFAYLAIILAMSYELSSDVIRSAQLAKEVAENERRWGMLLENVRLLVAGVDREGRIDYVNPHFKEVTGYSEEEVLGRTLTEFVPEEEREALFSRYRKAMEGDIRPHHQGNLLRKDGTKRRINWSNVILGNSENRITGTLSIGEDVTDLGLAEKARDQAIEELETLKNRLEEENIYLKTEIREERFFSEIIGKSNALLYVLTRVQDVAETDTTVLVQGETGVGKELVARAVHDTGPRTNKPFIKVNCAALPPNLVESELFGHERGSFTGADRQRKGRFELADGGTLFLDEISELPLEIQAKLLRILQDGEFERVGGSRTLKADVRVIAATNHNLNDEVAFGRFRPDLYYRLNVYPISVPPLRKRLEDIPLLVDYFVPQIASRIGKHIDQIDPRMMESLMTYDWPGNVRELRNVLERAVITSADSVLHLPEGFGTASPEITQNVPEDWCSLEEAERRYILKVLEKTGGRVEGQRGAAELLQLKPSTLRFRINKLGIKRKRFAEYSEKRPKT